MRSVNKKRIILIGAVLAMALIIVTVVLFVSLSDTKKKTDKPKATAQAVKDDKDSDKEIEASGKGNNKSDVPLVIGVSEFEKKFNPFQAVTENDARAVDFTQLKLVTIDREGALINKAIKGETRKYNGEDYSYQGPANIKVTYDKKKNETTYSIRIRKDMIFSDETPVTIDDVIFSMYAFADVSYDGIEVFGQLPIVGMKKYQESDEVKNISGIRKITDYKMEIRMKEYDRDAIYALNIPICPLHFYGEKEKYNYEKNQFGFDKGDISSLIKKKNSPAGAGAYNFIKYESGIVYYEANENYYLGYPLTVFIQLKELGDADVAHRIEILKEGDVDIVDLESGNETITQITTTNSNGKYNGGTISTRLYDGEKYAYIGMNAEKVCVDEKKDSTRSKNLRKGLATLLGSNRYDMVEMCTQSSKVINYPASDTSWSVPQTVDEEYQTVFMTDVDGNVIYNSDMTVEERAEAAQDAALEYFKLAGYKVKKGKIVSAPDGASKEFNILIPKDADKDNAMYTLVSHAKPMFQKIGLRLVVIDGLKQKQIDKMLRKGNQQLWCGFADTEVNGDLYSMFHSKRDKDIQTGQAEKNYFKIADSDLDEYIEESLETTGLKKSIRLYSQCYSKVLDWAVLIPMYQERDIEIFSSSRINMETIIPDITTYYSWQNEIHTVQMK